VNPFAFHAPWRQRHFDIECCSLHRDRGDKDGAMNALPRRTGPTMTSQGPADVR
jgi:hypothetical protein